MPGCCRRGPRGPIATDERIHVVGRRRAPGRPRPRCSRPGPGRRSTAAIPAARASTRPALRAAGVPVAPAHDAAHVAGRRPAGAPRRHEGAHRDRPRPSRARRGPRRGDPARAVAAGGRGRGGRAAARRDRRHARQEHVRGLARPRARGRRPRSRRLRRGAAAGGPHRDRRAGDGEAWRGCPVRRRGRRVRRQLRRLPPGRHRADLRRVGPPRRVRGPRGGPGRLRGVDPGRGCPGARRERRGPGRRGARRAARRLGRAGRRDVARAERRRPRAGSWPRSRRARCWR